MQDSRYDGGPDAWFTPGATWRGMDYAPDAGAPAQTTLRYANAQEGCPISYHERAMGFTRANVIAVIAGGDVIVDDNRGRS